MLTKIVVVVVLWVAFIVAFNFGEDLERGECLSFIQHVEYTPLQKNDGSMILVPSRPESWVMSSEEERLWQELTTE